MTRPASVLRALRAGLREVAAARAWVFLAYGWNLALAACLAAVLYESIRASLGSSLAGDRMRAGWDSLWYYGFSARASGVAATLKPSVVGVGAVLDGLDAFLDGFLSLFTGGVGSGVLPIAALYLLSWTFLGGGFLGTFLKTSAPEGFLARAGRHFPRLVAVSLAGLAACFVILGPFRDRLDAVREGVVHDAIDERVRFAWTLAEYLLLWAIVLAVNVVLDYAKVFVVRDGQGPILRSISRAIRFVVAHPVKVAGLYLATGLLWVGLLLLYALVAPGANQSSGAGIAAAFLVGQAYVLGRVALRCLFYASEVALRADLEDSQQVAEAA